MGLQDRIRQFVEYKGLQPKSFESIVGLSNGAFAKLSDNTRQSTIDRISTAFPELNQSWLRSGDGEMLKEYVTQSEQELPLVDTSCKYETYLLPQSAMGGTLAGFPADGAALQNCEKVISPICGVDFAITVYGDSMAPEYPSGSRVLIKKVNPEVFIDWGKAYVLDTSNGVIIKEVVESAKEGCIRCHSINPDPKFSDFDVPMSEIYGIYRVLMCLSAK